MKLGVWMLAAAFAAAVATPAARAAEGGPDGAKGFAGMVKGRVISATVNEAAVEVTAIEHVWKHSTAADPKSLVGKRITIRVAPDLYQRKPGYLALVRKFFGGLKAGDVESFDVRQAQEGGFLFLELTEAQRTRVAPPDAGKEKRRPGPPEPR